MNIKTGGCGYTPTAAQKGNYLATATVVVEETSSVIVATATAATLRE